MNIQNNYFPKFLTAEQEIASLTEKGPGLQILASIRENKTREAARKKLEEASRSWIRKAWDYFFQSSPKAVKKAKIAALKAPYLIKERPTLKKILSVVNTTSNFFTAKEKKFIADLERSHLPQMARTKIGYELIEHLSQASNLTSLPILSFQLGQETFEVHDGTNFSHPIIVHATKLKTAPLILNNLNKFFSDSIKFSVSLFEKGKMFFHSNDPSKDSANFEDPIPHDDYYVALGLSVDPKNFYRNYSQDVGSPTYNRDSEIVTKGGNDRVRVESHIKMTTIFGLIGSVVQELQQRCYQHLKEKNALKEENSFNNPFISNTDRIYRLEALTEGFYPLLKDEKDEANRELLKLREETSHNGRLKHSYNGIINGSVFYNIKDQIKELVHLAKQIEDESLKQEISNLQSTFEAFHLENSRLNFFAYFNQGSTLFRLKMLFHSCITLRLGETLRRYLVPYSLLNYQDHRLTRILGPTELLNFTQNYSYNELEALSHEGSKQIGARPIQPTCIVMSRNALNKLQKTTDLSIIEQFKQLSQSAKNNSIPIVIVDTYDDEK